MLPKTTLDQDKNWTFAWFNKALVYISTDALTVWRFAGGLVALYWLASQVAPAD